MPIPQRWRMLLDPRDPDYVDPPELEDDAEPEDDHLTEDELDQAASEAESRWIA